MNIILIVSLLVCSVLAFFIYRIYSEKLNADKQLNDMGNMFNSIEEEKKILENKIVKYETEKANFEEKNKKIWQMNEQVYKEKKKVDEEFEQVLQTKQKLETEKTKLDERVKKLWQQSTAIHTEKEKINQLKMIIEEKHQSIKDSIDYARIIQNAILPPVTEIQKHFSESFILYKPRDIVSGDFYWFAKTNENEVIIGAADCTGHGVPGAFMSMIGNTLLNEIVNDKKIQEPDLILNQLNISIRFALKQDSDEAETRDGMDISICIINYTTKVLKYAGANRPLWFLRKNENKEYYFSEIKANKFPIGGIKLDTEKSFTMHKIDFVAGDIFYIFTDGFADQFGGIKGKKYMTPNFQKLLIDNANENMQNQGKLINDSFENWRGLHEQVDDVLVIGFKL